MRTRTKLSLLTAVSALSLVAASAMAEPALTLYNTGVLTPSTGGPIVLAANGSVDLHYALMMSSDPTFPGPAALLRTVWDPAWTAAPFSGPNSNWISPNADDKFGGLPHGTPPGPYVYATTFDLTGFDPTSVVISGQWASDNSGWGIKVNGVDLGPGFATSDPSYANFHAFTFNASTPGVAFNAGVNTIAFGVDNTGGPTTLRVELAGTGNLLPVAVPEPGTYAMFGAGLVGMLGFLRRKRA